jgi:hypothetical protein
MMDEFRNVPGYPAAGEPTRDAGSRPSHGAEAGADAGLDPASGLSAALAHRYGFDGVGVNPTDAVGGAPAYIHNGSLEGQGFVRLRGGDEYVSLPNGLLSSSSDKTIEVWLTWRGGEAWQRVFDFGASTAGELNRGVGTSYLFLTPTTDDGVMLVAYTTEGSSREVRLTGTEALPQNVLTHVAVVVDSARDMLYLYLDGALHAGTRLTQRLGSIDDFNVWIGRSQFAADPSLDADVTELRIYDAALAADQVALSHQLGPDAALGGSP